MSESDYAAFCERMQADQAAFDAEFGHDAVAEGARFDRDSAEMDAANPQWFGGDADYDAGVRDAEGFGAGNLYREVSA